MSNHDHSPEFSHQERDRIIIDIMHWKCELESDQDFPPEEFQSFLEKLRSLNDKELKQFWEEHVGEWLASRDDLNFQAEPDKPRIIEWHEALTTSLNGSDLPEQRDFDTWLDAQFEKLINGEPTDYGYVVNVDVQPQSRGVA